jgi:hypothetical protein
MNPFVNIHYRGVELPPGCKDLIDVLQSPWAYPGSKLETFRVKTSNDASQVGGLADLGYQMSRMFTLTNKSQSMLISGKNSCLALYRRNELLRMQVLVLRVESCNEQMIREMFEMADLHPIEEVGKGKKRALKCPLPNTLNDVIDFIDGLLRKGYGFNYQSRLDFWYFEH